MDELRRQYQRRIDQYNALVADSIQSPKKFDANLVTIRRLNAEIATLLDKMMGHLAMVKRNDTNFIAQRDQLYKNLARIQRESNALTQDKDTLETLRRIREFDESETKTSMNIYVIAFLLLAVVVLIVLVFKRPAAQSDMTITMPSSPAAIPALT